MTIEEKAPFFEKIINGEDFDYKFSDDEWHSWKSRCGRKDMIRFITYPECEFRETQKPEYVPFDRNDAAYLLGKIIRKNNANLPYLILFAGAYAVEFSSDNKTCSISYEILFDNYKFYNPETKEFDIVCGKLKQ